MVIIKPLVSIIIPMYNAEKYIDAAIESVLKQTCIAWELLLIDDGSTDQTKECATSYLRDKRIKYHYQPNRGIANARNTGIKLARGKYLALIDADDVWEPHKLERQLEIIKEKDVSLVFSLLKRIDEKGAELGLNSGSGSGLYNGFSAVFLLLAGSISIPNSSIIVDKSWVEKVGNYNETDKIVRQIEDYDLLVRLLNAGANFYGINEILGAYRRHPEQITHDSLYKLVAIEYLDKLIVENPSRKASLVFVILLRVCVFYQNNKGAKEICTNLYFSNNHIKHYWFDKFMIKLVKFDNYLKFRMLLIRKFRKYETFVRSLER